MNAQSKLKSVGEILDELPNPKGVHRKLSTARQRFHTLKLKKSGHNKFADYTYFELGDFLIPALQVFDDVGLGATVSFDREVATMTIVDLDDPEQRIVITSPMGSAALKGCHEVQNIGAVETYQRRYLWVAALEIVEHDALDRTTNPSVAVSNGIISEAQWEALEAAADKVGADKIKLARYLGVESLRQLPTSRIPDAEAAIEAKAKAKQKEVA